MQAPKPRAFDKDAVMAQCETAADAPYPAAGLAFISEFIGVKSTLLPEGAPHDRVEACRMHFEAADWLMNANGVLHGGVIATVIDSAMGHLVHSVAGRPLKASGATLELKVQYMRAITGGLVLCEARFQRSGRRISYLEARMWDSEARLCASGTATFLTPQRAEA